MAESNSITPPTIHCRCRTIVIWVVITCAMNFAMGMVSDVEAKPTAPSIFCSTYPRSPHCAGAQATCTMCHTVNYPPAWNVYGTAVLEALSERGQYDFETALPEVLRAIEDIDHDEDGRTTRQEIEDGTWPAQPSSFWSLPEPLAEPPTPSYASGRYDFAFALKRVGILYCGRSPDYDAMQAMRDTSRSEDAKYEALHAYLDDCLQSEFWRDEALPRLADWRIRPIYSIGPDGSFIQLGDYRGDYRLWSYILTDGRDARDLLLAQYHVDRRSDGTLEAVNAAEYQNLVPERRAGMITTSWFILANTMFSGLPRTTAAQAYRAYLGFDISKDQGLYPIASEPTDVDEKGVAAPECAVCHSTLDPLAYAFAPYRGLLENGALGGVGVYDRDRPKERIPNWDNNQAYLLGQPVDDLLEWAEVAANSDAFARNLSEVFFEHALGRPPRSAEYPEFEYIWKRLPSVQYSADALIHMLIDTYAFGAP